ncbi:MAG: MG2 domain-containing protein, partial [Planctomycetota bacterium]
MNNDMNCDRIEPLIIDSVYGDSSREEQEGLEKHLATCEGCRKLAQTYRHLRDRLTPEPSSAPPADAVRKVITASRRTDRTWIPALLLLAASFAAFVALLVWPGDTVPPSPMPEGTGLGGGGAVERREERKITWASLDRHRMDFAEKVRVLSFEGARAEIEAASESGGAVVRLAAEEALAELLARRDLKAMGSAVRDHFRKARELCRTLPPAATPEDSALLISHRYDMFVHEARLVSLLDDGVTSVIALLREGLADHPPESIRERFVTLLANHLASGRADTNEKREADRIEAVQLLESQLRDHPDSPWRDAWLFTLSLARLPRWFVARTWALPSGKAVRSLVEKWEEQRLGAIAALTTLCEGRGASVWRERGLERLKELKSVCARHTGEVYIDDEKTRTRQIRFVVGPHHWPVDPAPWNPTPAERLDVVGNLTGGEEGERWTIYRLPGRSVSPQRYLEGDFPALEEMEVVASGDTGTGVEPPPCDLDGVYTIVREGPNFYGAWRFSTSRIYPFYKVTPEEVIFLVADRPTGQPVEGALIHVTWSRNEAPPGSEAEARSGTVELNTAADGTAVFTAPKDTELEDLRVSFVVKKGDAILAESAVLERDPTTREYLSHVLADRPIYRPGETVKYLCTIRYSDGGVFHTTAGDKYLMKVRDPSGKVIHRSHVETDRDGCFEGSFRLGENVSLGEIALTIKPDKDRRPEDARWDDMAPIFDEGDEGCFVPEGGKIIVQAYRRPEFEVSIDHPREVYRPGEKIEAVLEATYFHGGPLANAEGDVMVFADPYTPENPLQMDPWLWWDEEEESDEVEGMESYEFQIRTDENGRAVLTIPADNFGMGDWRYKVRVTLTDPSDRYADGAFEFRVADSELYLYSSARRTWIRAGTTVPFDIAARDGAEAPLDVKGRAKLFHLGEGRVVDEADFETQHDGNGQVALKTGTHGEYTLILDVNGAKSVSHHGAELWVWGEGGKGPSPGEDEEAEVNVRTDRKVYTVGETAIVHVEVPGTSGVLWVSAEDEKVRFHRSFKVEGPVTACPVPITGDCAPNVYIVVAYAGDGGVHLASTYLGVEDPRDTLKVELTPDRLTHGPAEDASVRVRVTDSTGKARTGRIALSVVDRALYTFFGDPFPHPAEVFRRPEKNSRIDTYGFTDTDGENLWFKPGESDGCGAPCFFEEAEDSGGVLAEGGPGLKIRRNFDSSACWRSFVSLDDRGEATVDFTYSDLLTRWTIRTDAASDTNSFGTSEVETRTEQPLVLRLASPRVFREGERVVLPVSVHNLHDKADVVAVSLSVEGATVTGGQESKLELGPGEEGITTFELVDFQPGSVKLLALGKGQHNSDAVELVLPCLRDGLSLRQDASGILKGGEEISVDLVHGTEIKRGKLRITVAPDLAAVVRTALPHLAKYPYGCTEQTMSRFLPAVVAQKSMKAVGISDPGLEAELPSMVEAGLFRLYDFQHVDGGWGWWAHDETDAWMTAYVTAGLAEAKAAGVQVDAEILKAARVALTDICNNDGGADTELRAFCRMALALAGEKELPGLSGILDSSERTKGLDPFSLSYLILALDRTGQGDLAVELGRKLQGKAKRYGDIALFSATYG